MIYWCDHPPSPQVLINTFYTQQVISQLRILSRSVATGSKFDRELWSNGLSPVLNLWKKLNQVGTHTASILPSVLFPFSESSYSLLPAPYSLFTLLLFCNHHREDWDSRPTLAEYYLGERTSSQPRHLNNSCEWIICKNCYTLNLHAQINLKSNFYHLGLTLIFLLYFTTFSEVPNFI